MTTTNNRISMLTIDISDECIEFDAIIFKGVEISKMTSFVFDGERNFCNS